MPRGFGRGGPSAGGTAAACESVCKLGCAWCRACGCEWLALGLTARPLPGALCAPALQVLARRLRLAGDFDFRIVAKRTPGYVGADLAALCKEAAALAVKRIFSQLEQAQQAQQQVGRAGQVAQVSTSECLCSPWLDQQTAVHILGLAWETQLAATWRPRLGCWCRHRLSSPPAMVQRQLFREAQRWRASAWGQAREMGRGQPLAAQEPQQLLAIAMQRQRQQRR